MPIKVIVDPYSDFKQAIGLLLDAGYGPITVHEPGELEFDAKANTFAGARQELEPVLGSVEFINEPESEKPQRPVTIKYVKQTVFIWQRFDSDSDDDVRKEADTYVEGVLKYNRDFLVGAIHDTELVRWEGMPVTVQETLKDTFLRTAIQDEEDDDQLA